MSDNAKTVINVNLSFTTFLVLLILKLTNTVDWSWWIITLPLYLPLAILVLLIGIISVFGFIFALYISIMDD